MWKLPQNGLRDRRYFRVRGIQAGIRLQVDFDERLPIDGHRFNVFDIVHQRCQDSLIHSRNAAFHLLRVEPGILPRDGDDRNIDIGKDVRWGAENHYGREYQNEQSDHYKGVRSIESKSDYPHNLPVPLNCKRLASGEALS